MNKVLFYAFTPEYSVHFQVKFLPDDSNSGRYLALSGSSFRGGTRMTSVSIVWGLKEQDLSTCHRTDAACTGETVFDDTFNMNSANAQTQLKVRD